MTETTKNQTPAFPNPALADPEYIPKQGDSGMSLRGYFLGQVMPALVRRCASHSDWANLIPSAVELADAMVEVETKGRTIKPEPDPEPTKGDLYKFLSVIAALAGMSDKGAEATIAEALKVSGLKIVTDGQSKDASQKK